jgi:hypothetical protein
MQFFLQNPGKNVSSQQKNVTLQPRILQKRYTAQQQSLNKTKNTAHEHYRTIPELHQV